MNRVIIHAWVLTRSATAFYLRQTVRRLFASVVFIACGVAVFVLLGFAGLWPFHGLDPLLDGWPAFIVILAGSLLVPACGFVLFLGSTGFFQDWKIVNRAGANVSPASDDRLRKVRTFLNQADRRAVLAIARELFGDGKYAALALDHLSLEGKEQVLLELFCHYLKGSRAVTLESTCRRLRLALIEKMFDQGILYLAFRYEPTKENREQIIRKIMDDAILFRIAMGQNVSGKWGKFYDPRKDEVVDFTERMAALTRIQNTSLQRRVERQMLFAHGLWDSHRLDVINRISDDTLLEDFLHSTAKLSLTESGSNRLYSAAIERIRRAETIERVAETHESPLVRKIALVHVRNLELLARIRRQASRPDIGELAEKQLLSRILGGDFTKCSICAGRGENTKVSVTYGHEVFGPYGGETGFRTPDEVMTEHITCERCQGRGWIVVAGGKDLELDYQQAFTRAKDEARQRGLL